MKPIRVNPDEVTFPVLAFPKYNGMQCHVWPLRKEYVVYAGNKLIPNFHIQWQLGRRRFVGYDGMITIGDYDDPLLLKNTKAALMNRVGIPDFTFHVFDVNNEYTKGLMFADRIKRMKDMWDQERFKFSWFKVVRFKKIKDKKALKKYELDCVEKGFSGIIMKDPTGFYTPGRRFGINRWMMEISHFVEDIGEIVGVEYIKREKEEIPDEELFYARRLLDNARMRFYQKITALVILWRGREVVLDRGFSEAYRRKLYRSQRHLIGKTVIFRYFHDGSSDEPLYPTFVQIWKGSNANKESNLIQLPETQTLID